MIGDELAGLETAKVLTENGKNVAILERSTEEDIGNKPCAGIVFSRTEQHINDLIPEEAIC